MAAAPPRPAIRKRKAAHAAMVNVVTDYQISAATVRDVHAIRRLEQIVFPLDAYTYLSLSNLLMWPGGSNFKATDPEGELVGFVAGGPHSGTPTPLNRAPGGPTTPPPHGGWLPPV